MILRNLGLIYLPRLDNALREEAASSSHFEYCMQDITGFGVSAGLVTKFILDVLTLSQYPLKATNSRFLDYTRHRVISVYDLRCRYHCCCVRLCQWRLAPGENETYLIDDMYFDN